MSIEVNYYKNYHKIAIRTILRHKGYSFINVVGLAIGMTCCLLILMWVLDELMDRTGSVLFRQELYFERS